MIVGKSQRATDTIPLPRTRLEDATPFTVCGIEFTGILIVKTAKENKVLHQSIYLYHYQIELLLSERFTVTVEFYISIRYFFQYLAKQLYSILISERNYNFFFKCISMYCGLIIQRFQLIERSSIRGVRRNIEVRFVDFFFCEKSVSLFLYNEMGDFAVHVTPARC